MTIPSGHGSASEEVDYLPLSALQHFAYCRRQFALIHLERLWEENLFTAEGRVLHERANSGEAETRRDLHIARTLRLRSRQLGVVGVADVVEFKRVEIAENGMALPGRDGLWRPFPVEYKRGRSKREDWDRIQLCAQGICLEEMLGVAISEGALYYGKPHRREAVQIDAALRRKTFELAEHMHEVWAARRTPLPEPGPKCERCSLADVCMPNAGSASDYLRRVLESETPAR